MKIGGAILTRLLLAASDGGEGELADRAGLFFGRLPRPAVLAAVGAAALLAAVWWLGRSQPAPTERLGRVLRVLRLGAAALLALALLAPGFRTQHRRVERASVFVLVDESQSMLLRDRYAAPAERAAVEDLLGADRAERPERMRIANVAKARLARALGERFRVETYAFAARLAPTPSEPEDEEVRRVESPALAPTGAETRLGSCLLELLEGTAGQPVAGVVVLSDGCSNAGRPVEAAADFARERGVPIYAIGLGEASPPRDLAARDLDAKEVCLVGDPMLFRARIESAGYAGARVEVVLEEDGRPVRREPVVLAGEAQDLEITHTPEKPGTRVYSLALPLQEGEAIEDNNRASATLRVEDAKVRVLLVAGEPTWEYRSLVAALARDKTVESSCYLQSADPTYPQEGSKPIERMPRGEADLYAYDVVILCGPDPNPVDFPAGLVEGLTAFVDERGGALLFVAAKRPSPYALKGQRAEELLDMLPAELDLSRDASEFGRRVFKEPWRVRRAPEAEGLPLLRLSDDPVENARVWNELPELYWTYPTLRLKPAAMPLLVRAGAGEGEAEIIAAVHFYGAGQAALVATDNLWRWRHLVGDRYYYRFWAQLVRHLAAGSVIGRSRPVQIATDRALYRPGEKVELCATVKEPASGEGAREGDMVPLRRESIDLVVQRVRSPGTEEVRAEVTLKPVPGRPGTYSGEYTVGATGTYEVWMQDAPRIEPPSAPAAPRAPAPETPEAESEEKPEEEKPGLARFEARLPARELAELAQRRKTLKSLAADTGGAYLGAEALGELDALAGSIPDRGRERLIPVEREVWDSPLLLALLIALLGVEWALRKHRGML